MALADEPLIAPQPGDIPLSGTEISKYRRFLHADWWVDERGIHRVFVFQTHRDTCGFYSQLTDIAESGGHHPTVTFSFCKAQVSLCTHDIQGISLADFILAAKTDRLQSL